MSLGIITGRCKKTINKLPAVTQEEEVEGVYFNDDKLPAVSQEKEFISMTNVLQ
jgi:hypothetical protein